MGSVYDLLGDLRQDRIPSPEALRGAIAALAAGEMSDAQVGALAMGLCRRPLDRPGLTALTQAMRDSGGVLTWDVPGPVLDKHSTGGVGDCVSLALAPALAACGAFVPMISGRGLGHTGGTLDKLEAIPGLCVDLELWQMRQVTREVGCAIVGATAEIAPADRRLYAVRDVTNTVASLDLIVASILSKKLAAGLDGLVLDVKVGTGAFMKEMGAARRLALALVETSRAAGCPAAALITDMSQPLVTAAGNALEVAEVMETLTKTYVTGALWTLVVELGGLLLARADMAESPEDGAAQIDAALEDGRAAERFGAMVAAQGGPRDFLDRWRDRLGAAPVVVDVLPERPGFVGTVDAEALGQIVVDLGGGRRRETDRIDPTVGLSHMAGIGEEVGPNRPLARVHARDRAVAEAVAARVRAAFTPGDGPTDPPRLVKERVG